MNHPPTSPITGLSEADAQQRRSQGLGNNVEVKTSRTYGQIVRGNLFTFFNIVLFSLAALLLLLGSPRDALFTGAIRAAQRRDCHRAGGARQAQSQRDLLFTRPTATVLRDGALKTLDPALIVVGDILVVGPGDQVIADGVVVGAGEADFDESLLTGEADATPKRARRSCSLGPLCHQRQSPL